MHIWNRRDSLMFLDTHFFFFGKPPEKNSFSACRQARTVVRPKNKKNFGPPTDRQKISFSKNRIHTSIVVFNADSDGIANF